MTLVMMLSLLPTAVLARDTGSGDPQEAEDTAEPAPKNGFRLRNEAENKMAENWRSFADDTKKQICYN